MDSFQHGLRLWQITAPQSLALALLILGMVIKFA